MTDNNDSNDAEYTIRLNNKEYELNREARLAIQNRAEHEYEENPMFSCFWKTAHPSQYEDGEWEDTIHEEGDPVLVIETEGPMVPWERMDKLNVEMQEVGPQSQLDQQADGADPNSQDNGNGIQTVDPSEIDGAGGDPDKTIGRTHFGITPERFEEVPSPDGEEEDKIPAKPEELGDDPKMVAWVPDHPDIEHSWDAGEAICPMYNRVEWNVQVKADQPRPNKEKDNSHNHWESLLQSRGCDVVAKLQATQDATSDKNKQSKKDVEEKFKNGKRGGNNWQV